MDKTEFELTPQDENAEVEAKDLSEEEINEVAGGGFEGGSQTVTTVIVG